MLEDCLYLRVQSSILDFPPLHIQHNLPTHSSHSSTFPCDSSECSYIHPVNFTTTFLSFKQFTPKMSCLSFAPCFAIQNNLQPSRLISTFSIASLVLPTISFITTFFPTSNKLVFSLTQSSVPLHLESTYSLKAALTTISFNFHSLTLPLNFFLRLTSFFNISSALITTVNKYVIKNCFCTN